jgi:hypothetical protein
MQRDPTSHTCGTWTPESMTAATLAILDALSTKTQVILSARGRQRDANALSFCRLGWRCNHLTCPRCSWVKRLKRSKRIRRDIASAIHGYESHVGPVRLFAFTMTSPDLPVTDLRAKAHEMNRSLTGQIERRRRAIPGAFRAFESVPAECVGELLDLEHAHLHGLLAVSDPESPSLRAFASLPHFQPIVGAKDACNWVSYALKSKPADFKSAWEKALRVPQTFLPRLDAMKGFRPVRLSGMFYPT